MNPARQRQRKKITLGSQTIIHSPDFAGSMKISLSRSLSLSHALTHTLSNTLSVIQCIIIVLSSLSPSLWFSRVLSLSLLICTSISLSIFSILFFSRSLLKAITHCYIYALPEHSCTLPLTQKIRHVTKHTRTREHTQAHAPAPANTFPFAERLKSLRNFFYTFSDICRHCSPASVIIAGSDF